MAAGQSLDEWLLSGMSIIGEKFKNNEVYVPEVLIAARAMNAGMEILKPVLVSSDTKSKGKAVMGTVKGDLHDIGKNLVKIMFEGKGIEVVDLGVDVTPEKFVRITSYNVCYTKLLRPAVHARRRAVPLSPRSSGFNFRAEIFLAKLP